MSTLDGTELLTGLQGGVTKNATPDLIRDVVKAVAATSTDGVILETSTAATVGAQKWSPRIRWKGFGWKTDATAASQAVEFAAEVQPVQGAAAPTGSWVLKSAINGGAYSDVLTIGSAGTLNLKASGVSKFAIDEFGNVTQAAAVYDIGVGLRLLNTGPINQSAGGFKWTSGNASGTVDTAFHRKQAKITENNDGTAGSYVGTAHIFGPMTVAQLPAAAAGLAGARATVSDATAPTFLGALTGGGAVVCPVFCNGSAWVAG